MLRRHLALEALLQVGELPPGVLERPVEAVELALDAVEGQGKVVLTIGPGKSGQLEFLVEDEGPGMPASVLKRAREPFFTTKEHGQGMGLGLYLARLIAERHGGALTLESAPGAGSTATLTLPRNGAAHA